MLKSLVGIGVLVVSMPLARPGETTREAAEQDAKKAEVRARLDRKIPLHFDDVPVEDVLGFIRSATAEPGSDGMRFALDLAGPVRVGSLGGRRVTIHTDNESIKGALGRLLGPLQLRFEAVDGLILISRDRPGRP